MRVAALWVVLACLALGGFCAGVIFTVMVVTVRDWRRDGVAPGGKW